MASTSRIHPQPRGTKDKHVKDVKQNPHHWDNSKIKLGIPSLILLLLFDIFKTIFQYFTIYCDPLNGQPVDSENVNHQGNTDNNLK